jgi:hypothetical protein
LYGHDIVRVTALAGLGDIVTSIPLTQVYEKTNRRGRRYMVGRIGTVKLLVVATDQFDRGEPVWQVYLGQGPYPPEGAAELAREVEQQEAAR